MNIKTLLTLRVLLGKPQGMIASEIARACEFDRPYAHVLLPKLIDDGFVRRHGEEPLYSLTSAGCAALLKFLADHGLAIAGSPN